MNDLTQIYQKYCNVVDRNTKGAQIGIYSVALMSLTIALRRVRPFSKFRKPTDIPKLFIKQRRELKGVVDRIEPNGALLMVKHKPLISLPSSNKTTLPVKISELNISGHGINWLQAIVAGNEINFIPIRIKQNAVECEVYLPQLTKKKTIRNLNIGESLAAVGFGNIEATSTKDPLHRAYINKLKTAEENALRKKLGLKYYVAPTKILLITLMNRLMGILNKIKEKQKSKVPKVTVS